MVDKKRFVDNEQGFPLFFCFEGKAFAASYIDAMIGGQEAQKEVYPVILIGCN
jgi:hypothetical protein